MIENDLCGIGSYEYAVFIHTEIIVHLSFFCTRLNLFMIMERVVVGLQLLVLFIVD